MVNLSKSEIVLALVARDVSQEKSTQYADAFIEYREASANIEKNGIITLHPRTANPMENPYLAIRDRALKKLSAMRVRQSDFLWVSSSPPPA